MTKRINQIADLVPDPNNANDGTERGRYLLQKSLEEVGAGRSIVVDRDGQVIGGNKTLETWAEMGGKVRVVETAGDELVVVQRTDLDLSDPSGRARAMAYYDNRVAELDLAWNAGQMVQDMQAGANLVAMFKPEELAEIFSAATAEAPTGAGPMTQDEANKTLAEQFIVPPFSVLDARQGYWRLRKQAWIALGIKSELGRGEDAAISGAPMPLDRAKTLGAIPRNQDAIKGRKASYATKPGARTPPTES